MSRARIVDALKQAALDGAREAACEDTPASRLAYARGVRSMASLVHACINVAEQSAVDHKDNPIAETMFKGYAKALRMIVKHADDLIPEGYEP